MLTSFCLQSILVEEDRVVCLRFGHDHNEDCMAMDETLYSVSEKVQNFCVIYLGMSQRLLLHLIHHQYPTPTPTPSSLLIHFHLHYAVPSSVACYSLNVSHFFCLDGGARRTGLMGGSVDITEVPDFNKVSPNPPVMMTLGG